MKNSKFVFGVILLFVCYLIVFSLKRMHVKKTDTSTTIIVKDVTQQHLDHNKKEQEDLKLVKEMHDMRHVHCVDRCKICKTEGHGHCDGICSLCFAKK